MKIKLIGKIFETHKATISADREYREYTEYTELRTSYGHKEFATCNNVTYKFDVSIYMDKTKWIKKIQSKYFDNFKGRTLIVAFEEGGVVTEVFMPKSYLTSMSTEWRDGYPPVVNLSFEGMDKPIFHKKIEWGF